MACHLCAGSAVFARRERASNGDKQRREAFEGRKSWRPTTGSAEDSICGAASAGIRLRNQKPVSQLLRQVTKTERTISEMATHLAMEKHQRQCIGQDANHREHDQSLSGALMDRGPFQMSTRGHGLKHGGVNDPTAATQLMDEQRRNRTKLQIAGVEIRALL